MGKVNHKAKRPKDKYYQLAKEQGYRARSAFKLIQLNRKFDFLASARVCIDLCAAPGGWLQVAAKYMPAGSTIVGVDLAPIKAIRGVITHAEDITTPACRSLLKRDLAGAKADVVLHDGAPNVGQNWAKDAFSQSELTLAALKLATEFLRRGGLFVTKVFRSSDYNSLLWVFHQLFNKVDATKPHSSRNASAEIFVACREYKAPDKIDPRLLDARHVFKEVDDGAGTALGLAGGGGAGTLDVMHKKLERTRQRDGYDERLGPLLTRKLPVGDFIRSHEPVRVLTDASALVFDAQAEALGLPSHTATTEDVRASISDLKVVGKPEFKRLLKWRLAIRAAFPTMTARRGGARGGAGAAEGDAAADGAAGDEGEEAAEEEEAAAAPDSADEAEEMAASLGAEAAEALRARKAAKKRDGKLRERAQRRARLGVAHLRNVDLLDTEGNLFSLDAMRAATRGLAPAAASAALDGMGDVDLMRERLPRPRRRPGEAAESGDDEEGADDDGDDEEAAAAGGRRRRTGGHSDDDDIVVEAGARAAAARARRRGGGAGAGAGARGGAAAAGAEGSDDGDGGEEEEDDAEAAAAREAAIARMTGGDTSLAARLRAEAALERLDAVEDELDAAYARFVAGREARETAARAAGAASVGIKQTRRQRAEAEALVTQAALEGKLDSQRQAYLRLLAGARAAHGDEGAAADAEEALPEVAEHAGQKRKRGGTEPDEYSEDSDEAEDDEEDDDEEEEEADDEEGAGAGGGEGGGAAGAARVDPRAATRAARWFSRPAFAEVLAEADADDVGLPAPLVGDAKRRRAAAAAAGAAGDESDDDSDDAMGGASAGVRAGARGAARGGAAAAAAAPAARAGAGARGVAAGAAAAATSSRSRAALALTAGGRGLGDGPAAIFDADGDIDPLGALPKPERERWRERMRRKAERETARADRAAAKDGIKVVPREQRRGGGDDDDGLGDAEPGDAQFAAAIAAVREGAAGKGAAAADSDDDDGGPADADPAAAARAAAARALIRAGMGKTAAGGGVAARGGAGAGAGGGGGFEVVPAAPGGGGRRGAAADDDDDGASTGSSESGSSASSADPRDAAYDSETHAEMLALGAMMKSHTKAKALLDASYNRYAFADDVQLPGWFAADEARHFKPQLPISRAEVQALRDRFRDIAARPVAKVAEARARKKRRLTIRLDKAKRTAESALESEDLGARAKARAIARAYAAAGKGAKRPGSVYVVANKTSIRDKSAQGKRPAGGGKARVKSVDPRLKKDKRGAARAAAKRKGGGGGGKKKGGR